MGRIEIVVPRANGEADFSGFMLAWLSAFKMDKMATRGRLPIHLQEAPKLSKEWGEGQFCSLRTLINGGKAARTWSRGFISAAA